MYALTGNGCALVHCEGTCSTNIKFSLLDNEKCLKEICLDTDQCPMTNVFKDSVMYGPERDITLELLITKNTTTVLMMAIREELHGNWHWPISFGKQNLCNVSMPKETFMAVQYLTSAHV